MRISTIDESHISSSAEIIRKSFKTVADEFGLTRENSPRNSAFIDDERLLEEYKTGNIMYGLFENDKQIGFVALESKEDGGYHLKRLSVLPEYRSKGYGRTLLDHAKGYIQNAGGNSMTLGMIYENKRLLKWYEDYGFVTTGTKVFEHFPFTVGYMEMKV